MGTEEDRLIKFKEYWNQKCVTPLTTEELLMIEKTPHYITNRLESETANTDVLMIRDAKHRSENPKFATHDLMQQLLKTIGMSSDISYLEHDDCVVWHKEIKESLEPLYVNLQLYLKIKGSIGTPSDTINFIQSTFYLYTGTTITSKMTSSDPVKYNVVVAPDKNWIGIYNKLDYVKYRDEKLDIYYTALYNSPFTEQEKVMIIKHMTLINYQFEDRTTGLGKAWETLMTVLEIKENEKVTFPDRDDMFVKYKGVLEKPMREIKTLLKIKSGSLESPSSMVKFLNTVFTKMNGFAVKTSNEKKIKGTRHFEVIIEPNPALVTIYKKLEHQSYTKDKLHTDMDL